MDNEENKNIDFSELLKDLDNKWVVLSKDSTKVLAVADDLEEIDEAIEGVLMKVPDSKSYFTPYIKA